MAAGGQNLVGERVRKLRVAADLSQDALAGECQRQGWDITRGTFAKIEAGLRRVNDAEVIVLAKALKCELTDLLGGFSVRKAVEVARHGETNA
jgi:transcriptional regulator with XRE-family HTH domain